MLPALPSWLSAAAVDYFNVGCAVAFMFAGICIRGCSASQKRALYSSSIISDMMKGGSFFPFILLSFSVIWPELIDLLKATNKMTMFFGGVMASAYVLSDFVREAQGKRNGNGSD